MSALLCLCTCPDDTVANRIGRTLVDERLAACVNLLPGVRSIYRWQGDIETSGEVLLLIKSTADRFDALRDRIVALHPYELPEVIAVDITHGLPTYLNWIADSTRPDSEFSN